MKRGGSASRPKLRGNGTRQMSGIRRAFILATADRYVVTTINLLSLPVLARLLTPEEYGVAVLGGFIFALADPLRDLGSQAYLIQERELTRAKVQTAFTASLAMTWALAALIWLGAERIAAFYGNTALLGYLEVALLGFLIGPVTTPVFALLRREMAFGKTAIVNVTTASVYALLAISLAASGFSFMSIAYATVVSAAVGAVLGLVFGGRTYMFRPSLAALRSLLRYGSYETLAAFLERAWDNLPYILLGRLYGTATVGLYQRASLVCTLPERVLLSSVGSVTLPALAAEVRQERDIKETFLRILACMTAVQWPAMVCLALLAHPVVLVLLGSGWLDAVPIIQVMALAMLLNIPPGLVYPTLAAIGGVRHGSMIFLVFVPTGAAIFAIASLHSVLAAAASLSLAFLLKTVLSLHFVRHYSAFSWRELRASVRPSAVVTLCAVAGPTGVVLWHGTTTLAVGPGLVGGLLAVAGFAAGLRASGHPLHAELAPLAETLARGVTGALAGLVRSWNTAGEEPSGRLGRVLRLTMRRPG